MTKSKMILIPIISEKTVHLGRDNRYAFWVSPQINKEEIARAVKELFKVEAVGVNIITLPGKRKRFRGTWGQREKRKKAIVTLRKGQRIALFEEPKKEKE